MKRKIINTVILSFFIVLFSSCTTTDGYYFNSIDSDGVSISEIRGKSYETASTSDGIEYIAYAQPTYDGNEVQVSVGVFNPTDDEFNFYDSSIELSRGNMETNKWESLGQWSARNYYQKEYNKLKTNEVFSAIAGALTVLDSALGSTSTTSVSTPYGTSYITTQIYSPLMTGMTALAVSDYMDALTSSNQLTLQSLESSLLYSSKVFPKSNYRGNVYLDVDSSSPEYKLSFSHDDGLNFDFIFSRSDRYEVLHPWSDQTRDRHSIVFSSSITGDRMQLAYLFSRKNAVGFYSGFSLYNIFEDREANAPGHYYSYRARNNFSFDKDPDPTDSYDKDEYKGHVTLGESITTGMGTLFGIDYRILPNTWLMAGFDFIVNFLNLAEGKIQYENPLGTVKDYPGTYIFDTGVSSFDLGLQTGLNIITNFLDFNIYITYVIPNRFYLDLGIGFAF